MPWYENPTIAGLIGAAAGAVLAGLVSLFIWRKSRKISRIDCGIADPTSLLAISDAIKDKLEVKYEDDAVSIAYLFTLELVNSGTEVVSNQPVYVRLAEGSKIIDYRIETEPELGFGKIQEVGRNGNKLDLSIEFLNKGNMVSVEILSIDNPTESIEVGLQNKGIDTRLYTSKSVDSLISSISGNSRLTMLAALGMLPLIGGIARALTTLELARKVDHVGRRTSQTAAQQGDPPNGPMARG